MPTGPGFRTKSVVLQQADIGTRVSSTLNATSCTWNKLTEYVWALERSSIRPNEDCHSGRFSCKFTYVNAGKGCLNNSIELTPGSISLKISPECIALKVSNPKLWP